MGGGISEPQKALPWECEKALALRNREIPQGSSGVQDSWLHLSPVLKRTKQMQKEVFQLKEKGEWGSICLASCPSTVSPLSAKTFTSPFSLGLPVTQGLGDAGHDRDFIRGEVFRQMKAVLAGNGKESRWRGKRLCSFQHLLTLGLPTAVALRGAPQSQWLLRSS